MTRAIDPSNGRMGRPARGSPCRVSQALAGRARHHRTDSLHGVARRGLMQDAGQFFLNKITDQIWRTCIAGLLSKQLIPR
jgi:hypothetical protein